MSHFNTRANQNEAQRQTYHLVEAFDEVGATTAGCARFLARDDSMEVSNDPRFFSQNVMDKRLTAFKSLTIVSSVMWCTAVKLVFKLKKNQDFHKLDDPYVGSIAWWQFGAFVLAVVVTFMCLLSLYIMAHQLFYTYRLMTAGPTGFEQACVFYLTRTITMWRHLAMKSLFNGLLLFMVLLGLQLFVQFYRDADTATKKPHIGWLANVQYGSSQNVTSIHRVSKHKLNMVTHTILGYVSLFICASFAYLMIVIRRQHVAVFQENYAAHKPEIASLEESMWSMSHRGPALLDT
jgi:hypothetical protein